MRAGLAWDERFLRHDSGDLALTFPPAARMQPHPNQESPEGKARIVALLAEAGLLPRLARIAPRPATREELLWVHTPAHLARIEQASRAGGALIAPRMWAGPDTWDMACLAAGTAVACVEAVLAGTVEAAYALVRPPGHHAEAELATGLCFLANAAIAGKAALERHGLARIAYVDWDAHHGNGTQAAFWTDPRALTISLHQDGFGSSTGGLDQIGEGAGRGFNLNIPLPPGSGHGAYLAAFERIVVPALERFRPELILLPCGFDAGHHDPLARMMLTSESFRALTRMVMEVAQRHCRGRMVLVHEGGYAAWSMPYLALAVFETLLGEKTQVADPYLPVWRDLPGQDLQPHQDQAIARAAAVARDLGRI
ncbi:MAG: class II histone deacetylase [Alphaproteobacteria bacterium]|nr:class II histone deacetylase [Alphaproteobacteria bacterium]